MDLLTHGAKKYPHSALLKSSAGLGWSTIAAELRSHGASSTPVIVPQHTEVILAVAGNDTGLISRTGAGQLQEHTPTTGSVSLTPIAVGDNQAKFTAAIPAMLHLYLPTLLFRRLSDDFGVRHG
jgi:AraC family transcriptional regulator